MAQGHILTLSCPDRVGIVATLARLMERHDCFIDSSRTFGDELSGQFFARLVFHGPDGDHVPAALLGDVEQAAEDLHAEWDISAAAQRVKTLLLVSKSDHCANTLLYGARRKELPIDVVGIVSNHDTLKDQFAHFGLPWFHVPVTAGTKDQAEARLFEIIEETGAELIVLARYMQVLSNDACRRLEGRCINIHHSFLPSFKGAQPYHQAHARGVKVIGATAHYVTADLDEGPIITQVTEAIDHTFKPADMIETGRHLEGTALLRAVKAHAEHRIFSHSGRTVVFAR
ncbi:MAG: formyltetrahydrofolate deformylase [Hyphomonas sp.]|uniref:formyltetrahydrofolate deformylase n=1 Tax=Hyphomonas sp. TaxID=87 RepID=UPI00352707DF